MEEPEAARVAFVANVRSLMRMSFVAAPAEPPVRVAAGRAWPFALLVVLAVLAAYANSFPGAFFFDDGDAILANTSIRDLHNWRAILAPPVRAGIGGRPFANLTFALNYAANGYNPAGYHAVNLAIHLLAALLLFAVTRRTLLLPSMRGRFGRFANAGGALVALFWGLQPLQANIADYVSQRTEGLMAALYLLTLYAFIRSVEQASRAWAAVAIAACALGMATKEDMVTLPAVVWLYDRTFLSGSFLRALRAHAGRYLGLVATWGLLAYLMLTSKLSDRGVGFGLGRSWSDYALTELQSIRRYLTLSVWPHPLVFDYGPKYLHGLAAALPDLLLVVAVGALAIVALWRAPRAGFCLAAFFILLSPSSSVVPVVEQPCAENRVYLPLVGIAALVVVGAIRLVGRRAVVMLAVAAVALGLTTAARNRAFASETAVWWDTVAKNPTNARANNNLGNSLLKDGHTALAAPYFDAAIRLSPRYADAHNNRGVVLLREGHPRAAITEFQAALRYKARYANAQYNLGEALLEANRPAEAIPALEAARRLDPNSPKTRNDLGMALLNVGRVAESITQLQAAIRLDPGMAAAHYNLGNSFSRAGRVPEALAEYDAALRLNPRYAQAENNAGVLLLHQGRLRAAAARFEAALRIDPKYAAARSNLALTRSKPAAR